MTPRNEFKAGDLEGKTDAELLEMANRGEVTVNQIREFKGLEKLEALDQEVDPVEDDPHLWPSTTVAELRKSSGLTTTAAHIAEIKSKSE